MGFFSTGISEVEHLIVTGYRSHAKESLMKFLDSPFADDFRFKGHMANFIKSLQKINALGLKLHQEIDEHEINHLTRLCDEIRAEIIKSEEYLKKILHDERQAE